MRIIIGLAALLFFLYAICYSMGSSLTLGLVLLYLIAAALGIWCVFFPSLMHFFRQTTAGRWIGRTLLILIIFYILMILFLALMVGVKRPDGSEQAVVVLGAGLRGEKVSPVLRFRLDAAFAFAKAHPEIPVVVTGGQGRGEACPEGVAMQKYLLEKGLPARQIFVEARSASTAENFRFAKQVLQENGYGDIRHIVLVTNRFHCYRAALIAARQGLDASAVPASINPSAVIPCYLREVFAVLYYWILDR